MTTFGVAHNSRVQRALEVAFADNPELAAVLDSHDLKPFFIKNIERVQGDERDAIILSVGYGKDADLAADRHPSDGYQLMYRFVRFASSGGTELSHDGPRPIALNPFELDVLNQLSAAGLDLVTQVGVGSYRLDFAARHPRHPGRYLLAVEADGASYHSGEVARERDRLRQRLLKGRGWTFHRIWSVDWPNDADAQVRATVQAFQEALERSDREDAGTPDRPTLDVPDEDPVWNTAPPTRTVRRPAVRAGKSIGDYTSYELVGATS